MFTRKTLLAFLTALGGLGLFSSAPILRAAPDGTNATLLIGGAGAVYFLAEPGELIIDLEKRDRNRTGSKFELRAVLAGPDRQVLQEQIIPDDGLAAKSGLGPAQRCRLSTRVARKGVYALNLTISNDRYGEQVVWGFQSNCRKYMIETARGHKDERHEEPIVLASPGRAANVCFLPPAGPFTMDLTGLPKDSAAPQVFAANGQLVAALTPAPEGTASQKFAAKIQRDALPWRLHLPAGQAVVNLDGVTRWSGKDAHPDMACWTPELSAWFNFLDNRELIIPTHHTKYTAANAQAEFVFKLHNDTPKPRAIALTLEFPQGEWPAKLSAQSASLAPHKTTSVTLVYTAPAAGQQRAVHIRATPTDDPDFSTYSTFTAKAGLAPATEPLTLPIVLKPYQHENEQFGYEPDYPTDNQLYFDPQNRPFARTSGGVAGLQDGRWFETLFSDPAKMRATEFKGASFGHASSKIAFDRDGDLYALSTAGTTPVLLHSADHGQTFSAYPIPGKPGKGSAFDIEHFSGHNVPENPPAFVRFTQTSSHEKLKWRRVNDLELFLPKKENGRLVIGEPILISAQCIGLAAHSGIPGSVVSRGAKVHVAWGEATDPQVKVPGLPAYAATYDRETKQLTKPALLGYGPPANDVHNSPSITMDSQGFLHVLGGTHGRPFPYAHSLKPNDAGAGWTPGVPTGDNLAQTYIGLVCGPDDTLYSAFRLWQFNVAPFPASSYGTLSFQRKRPGQPWEAARILVVAPFSEYSVFYHRLTIDRRGRLFLSYDYWSTFWAYRNDRPERQRAVLMSPDGGNTWKLAETKDL